MHEPFGIKDCSLCHQKSVSKQEMKKMVNKDNKMEIAIPRAALGVGKKSTLSFDFHWADNIQKADDITEFALSGDSAPNRRFNYRFEE